MKKIIIALLICMSFAFGVFADDVYREFTAKEVDYTIQKDNVVQKYTLPIVSIEDRTYVPIRELCENMNYTVDWNEEQKLIEINRKHFPLYEEDLTEKEGQINKNIKYRFYSPPRITYDTLLERTDWWPNQKYAVISNAEQAADVASMYFKNIFNVVKDDDMDLIVLDVNFHAEVNAWSVSFHVENNKISHGNIPIVVISADDGRFMHVI